MELDKDITILNQVQDGRYERNERIPTIRIEWQVGKFGPFVEHIDKMEYSADVRAERLNKQAAEHRVGPVPR